MSECENEIFSQEAGIVCSKTIENKNLKSLLKEACGLIDGVLDNEIEFLNKPEIEKIMKGGE